MTKLSEFKKPYFDLMDSVKMEVSENGNWLTVYANGEKMILNKGLIFRTAKELKLQFERSKQND